MGRNQDLEVGRGVVIPGDELEWTFSTSGGPGGQHANRSSTRAELRWHASDTRALPPERLDAVLARLGRRVAGGTVTIVADESRSQWRNRAAARRRLAELVGGALVEPRRRRPTRPPAAAGERRMEAKRRRGETKRLRRPPEVD